ncbi:MAG: hypothetical protein PF439_06860 [Helicobacteraceae bacterium]|jgi:endonuclease V-like protein UPF0215 family|nr:hypothetical protein [Helicobacteraceae bacterium]
MSDTRKKDSERILRIYQLCEEHFGAVRFVGVKFHSKIGWIAKVQFEDDVDFGNLTADGEDATDALRKLKNRVKKIIKRYNLV